MSKWEYTETEIWRHGENHISLFHVFGLIAVKNVVLVFAEAREGDGGDAHGLHDIWMRRSEDGGRSFEPTVRLELEEGCCWTNPVPLYDWAMGRLFLFYSDNPDNLHTRNFVSYSDDLGKSWSKGRQINSVMEEGADALPFHLAGPGHGICIRKGDYAGRLMVPVWHRRYNVDKTATERGYCVSALYSDDHGETWEHTAFLGQGIMANESRIEETEDGLIWVIRPGGGWSGRYISRSFDGGVTWSEPEPMSMGPANNCDAGVTHIWGKSGYENTVLVSRVSQIPCRRDMEVLLSRDGGLTFTDKMALPEGDAMPGYSDLCVIEEEESLAGLVHCRNNHVLFSRISMQALTGGKYENTKRTVWLS